MRYIQPDELEPLATGAWILGAGGGGNPYLSWLNLRRLYDDGLRVSLMDPMDLDDDDNVAMVAGIGAPLVGQERLSDPRFAAKPLLTMERYLRCRFPSLAASLPARLRRAKNYSYRQALKYVLVIQDA